MTTIPIEATVFEDLCGHWVVESLGPDGEYCAATFVGLNAEARARKYAADLDAADAEGK